MHKSGLGGANHGAYRCWIANVFEGSGSDGGIGGTGVQKDTSGRLRYGMAPLTGGTYRAGMAPIKQYHF